jgi:hypothetical protein
MAKQSANVEVIRIPLVPRRKREVLAARWCRPSPIAALRGRVVVKRCINVDSIAVTWYRILRKPLAEGERT